MRFKLQRMIRSLTPAGSSADLRAVHKHDAFPQSVHTEAIVLLLSPKTFFRTWTRAVETNIVCVLPINEVVDVWRWSGWSCLCERCWSYDERFIDLFMFLSLSRMIVGSVKEPDWSRMVSFSCLNVKMARVSSFERWLYSLKCFTADKVLVCPVFISLI